MAKSAITFTGFRQMTRALQTATAKAALEKHVAIGTGRALKKLEALVRQEVKRGVKPANAALTIALKGSSKPLVNHGDLFGAVRGEQTAWNRGFVGINSKADAFDLAKTLHKGVRIKVTQRMRNLFRVLFFASKARREGTQMPKLSGRAAELFAMHKDWYPLSQDTTVIRIPARPVITNALRSATAKEIAKKEWTDAVNRAIKEMRGK